MIKTGFLSVTVVKAVLLLMSFHNVQGKNYSCTETCEKYRIVDLAYNFSCNEITDATERSDCQANCQSCKEICNGTLVEKVFNCPDIQGKTKVESAVDGGEGRSFQDPASLEPYEEEDNSLTAKVPRDGVRETRSKPVVEREVRDEDTEKERGATNSRILVWVALVFVLLIVIVGGLVMVFVFFVPRRRGDRNRREPEAAVEPGRDVGQGQPVASGSDQSIYYPVIPPETQVVLRPQDQY